MVHLPYKLRFTESKWKFLINAFKKEYGLTGLRNLGNTCYMNSILQCLSNTDPLVHYFLSGKYRKDLNRSNKTKGVIAEEIAAVVEMLWAGEFRCIASKDFRDMIGRFQAMFRGTQQQDSHEFFVILIDMLHSDLHTISMPQYMDTDRLSDSKRAWLDFIKDKDSKIQQLFYGQTQSLVKCKECQEESATYDSFSNLSLELPVNSNFCKLDTCLQMYFNGEPISGWKCPNCKVERDAIKKLGISRLPQILVIQLKRFCVDSFSSIPKKKENDVGFPLENLDLRQYTTKSERRKDLYRLYGVSNHYGSMNEGHYTAFCKNSISKKWYKFDDNVVKEMGESDKVATRAAYVLFYTYLPVQPTSKFLNYSKE